MRRSHQVILSVILAAEIMVRVAVIWHAGPMTDQGFYGDDSYMSHKFAADIAAGRGITQAGEPTNGFQPLFVFLLVPFYWFLDIYQATVASAVLNSALSVAGSLLIFLLIRELFGVVSGLIAAGLWAISAHLTRVGLNGLETALANAMMLLAIWLHVRCAASGAVVGSGRGAGLGAVLGLALLSRLDLGLLLVPLGFDQARIRLKRRQFAGLAATVTAGVIVIAPWFAWSRVVCGSFVPVSGAATRNVAQLYGSPTGPTGNPDYFALGEVPTQYYTNNLAHAGRNVVDLAPLATPAVALFGRHAGIATAWIAIVAVLAALVSATPIALRSCSRAAGFSLRERPELKARAAGFSLRERPELRARAAGFSLRERPELRARAAGFSLREHSDSTMVRSSDCPAPDDLSTRLTIMLHRLWFIWVFAALLVAAYCFYYFAQWHFWRYLTPVTIALMIPSALLIEAVGRWLFAGGLVGKAIAALCVVGFVVAGATQHARLFGPVDPTGIARNLYHDATQLRETLPPGVRIGSFESGTLDYFLDRDVYNLDGKTNTRAYRALVDGRMDRLVTELDLDYVVSSPLLIRDLLDRRGQWTPGRLEIVGRLAHNLIVRVNPTPE